MKAIIIKILLSLVTEKFIKAMVLLALRKLAAKTDNEVDDEIVKQIERALDETQKK